MMGRIFRHAAAHGRPRKVRANQRRRLVGQQESGVESGAVMGDSKETGRSDNGSDHMEARIELWILDGGCFDFPSCLGLTWLLGSGGMTLDQAAVPRFTGASVCLKENL